MLMDLFLLIVTSLIIWILNVVTYAELSSSCRWIFFCRVDCFPSSYTNRSPMAPWNVSCEFNPTYVFYHPPTQKFYAKKNLKKWRLKTAKNLSSISSIFIEQPGLSIQKSKEFRAFRNVNVWKFKTCRKILSIWKMFQNVIEEKKWASKS